MTQIVIKYVVIFFIVMCNTANSYANGACFINSDKKNHPIRLKFTYSDYVQGTEIPAKIKYEKGSSEIEIKYLKDEIISVGPRMNVGKTTYAEIIDGKKNGTYYLTTEGAMPIELIYKSANRKKPFVFSYDHAYEAHDKCQWEVKE